MKDIYNITIKKTSETIVDSDDVKVIFFNDRLITIDRHSVNVIKAGIGGQFQITGDTTDGVYHTKYMGHV